MGRLVELLSGLGLHDQFLIHDHVQALLSEPLALVRHLHRNLARDTMIARQQLSFQSHYVNVFEEAETEGVVNIEERPDHRMREAFFKEVDPRHARKIVRATLKQSSISGASTLKCHDDRSK
jgi:hypothetical protein